MGINQRHCNEFNWAIFNPQGKSNNKKNDDVAANPGDFRTLYGEEVTGKYSEDQIDALMLQGHIDDKDDLTSDAELQKDQQDNFSIKKLEWRAVFSKMWCSVTLHLWWNPMWH